MESFAPGCVTWAAAANVTGRKATRAAYRFRRQISYSAPSVKRKLPTHLRHTHHIVLASVHHCDQTTPATARNPLSVGLGAVLRRLHQLLQQSSM